MNCSYVNQTRGETENSQFKSIDKFSLYGAC